MSIVEELARLEKAEFGSAKNKKNWTRAPEIIEKLKCEGDVEVAISRLKESIMKLSGHDERTVMLYALGYEGSATDVQRRLEKLRKRGGPLRGNSEGTVHKLRTAGRYDLVALIDPDGVVDEKVAENVALLENALKSENIAKMRARLKVFAENEEWMSAQKESMDLLMDLAGFKAPSEQQEAKNEATVKALGEIPERMGDLISIIRDYKEMQREMIEVMRLLVQHTSELSQRIGQLEN